MAPVGRSQRPPKRHPSSDSTAATKTIEPTANFCFNSSHIGVTDGVVTTCYHQLSSDGSSARKKEPVTFLDLPRELRDIMYDLATKNFEIHLGRHKLEPRSRKSTKAALPSRFADDAGNDDKHQDMKEATVATRDSTYKATNCGLIFTCKRIHHETLALYLRNTIFYLPLPRSRYKLDPKHPNLSPSILPAPSALDNGPRRESRVLQLFKGLGVPPSSYSLQFVIAERIRRAAASCRSSKMRVRKLARTFDLCDELAPSPSAGILLRRTCNLKTFTCKLLGTQLHVSSSSSWRRKRQEGKMRTPAEPNHGLSFSAVWTIMASRSARTDDTSSGGLLTSDDQYIFEFPLLIWYLSAEFGTNS
ncbi:hypothetical protein CERZMDRAFT_87309 [Cercospora zeae-maydis SCOH1-5]|uniref:DUF7730 domain-containing protein n=1 Tax=Cercospora zeae-maydis SCOH1-5 TaxID=717836 RepID=A0A6A6F357_9PEZI|nr:hypothetical protein CERZMDRAFT_87309 [Cercospora zeae-maydis SCOH1-5]